MMRLPALLRSTRLIATPASPAICASRVARSARPLSTLPPLAYQGNQQFYRKLVKDYGANNADQRLDTAFLFDALRDMQSWRSQKKNGSSPSPSAFYAGEYKAGLKAISQLIGEGGLTGKETVRIADIEQVLSLENGVVWRLIRELLEFGFSSELASLSPEQMAVVKLCRVHGFGRIKAEGYVQAGARTFDDLLRSTDKEYGRKVSDAQKLSLMYHDEMEVMIPRAEVELFHTAIQSALAKADPEFGFEIMGSFRRGETISSDVDMVVWHPSLVLRDTEKRKAGVRPESLMGRVKTAILDAGLLEEDKIFSQGEKKILALTRLPSSTAPPAKRIHRQIDIRLCPLQSLPYMLLGNSGDDTLMKLLRWRAADKGWVLNEYAMGERIEGVNPPQIKEGSEILVKTEQEIFEKLEVPYIPPTERSYQKYKNRMRQNSHLKKAPASVFEEDL